MRLPHRPTLVWAWLISTLVATAVSLADYNHPIKVALTAPASRPLIVARSGNHNPCGTVLQTLASRE